MKLSPADLRQIPIIDLMKMAGITREDSSGGASTARGGIQARGRINIDVQSGRAFAMHAGDAAAFSIALLRLSGF